MRIADNLGAIIRSNSALRFGLGESPNLGITKNFVKQSRFITTLRAEKMVRKLWKVNGLERGSPHLPQLQGGVWEGGGPAPRAEGWAA